MPWIKKGCILRSGNTNGESSLHTQVPTPFVMGDTIRMYLSCRESGKSFIAFIDIARNDFYKTLDGHQDFVMERGAPGAFDADGIMPSCVIDINGKPHMYYIGWSELKNTARYQNEIGLAESNDDGKTFQRKFNGPIMGRSPTEPGLAVMPFVMYKNWYRMWYQSGTGWHKAGDKYEPTYVIKYAESIDGINWDRNPTQCVLSKNDSEAFSRPSVIFMDGMYHMWFCYRSSEDYRGGLGSYKIGYAISADGVYFARDDYNYRNLFVGEEMEWDSEMQCYPYVIEIDGRLIMFYNGNGFGQTGIGYTVWEDD